MSDIFVPALLRWFEANGRDLPWRHTHDPYAIWLSEVILQQTRVVQGQAYWERFMKTYPTVRDLASASEDDVLLLWEGLGYYSRARNLWRDARQVWESGGQMPRTAADLASGLLRKALDAFARLDTKAAVDILKEDDQIDREFDGFVRKLITYMMEDPRTISASLDLLFLAKAIERIGDHSKNISELIIYLVEGQDVRHRALSDIESVLR